MARKVEMDLAHNFGGDFFRQRKVPLDEQGRPFVEVDGPIKGSSIKQPLGNTVIITGEKDAADTGAQETIFVFPGDGKSISWVVYGDGVLRFEGGDVGNKDILGNIRQASQRAHDAMQARLVSYSSRIPKKPASS